MLHYTDERDMRIAGCGIQTQKQEEVGKVRETELERTKYRMKS